MSEPIGAHTLNACLARVIGKKLASSARGDYWLIVDEDENELIEWDPLHDANQMEEVKEFLRDNDIRYESSWSVVSQHHEVRMNFSGYAEDRSELRAFALAVQAMEQSQKEK